jgi:3-hexulose-6-phosphate synthase
MDAAGDEVSHAVPHGADIVTILGAAEDMSIQGAVEQAKKSGKQILVEMIAVKDLATRAKELN